MKEIYNKKIAIVLPTYNGEKYISPQIKSILYQTYQNWILYIRDDNSKDDTKKILLKYKKRFPEKIILIENDNRNLGVNNNVFTILQYVKESYIMFCDQDDIWKKEKIEITYKKMLLEEHKDKKNPILVHCDSYIVDEKLTKIISSFTKYEKINRNKSHMCNLVFVNIVQGSTMMINKALLNKIKNVIFARKVSFIYDQYIALVASAFGKIVFINKPLLYYRQHSNNQVGGKKYRMNLFKFLITNDEADKNNFRYHNYWILNRELVRLFLKNYSTELEEKKRKKLKNLLHHFTTLSVIPK